MANLLQKDYLLPRLLCIVFQFALLCNCSLGVNRKKRTMNKKDQKQFVSDVIGDDYKSWKKGEAYFLSAGTGTGKTTFLSKELADWLYMKGSGKRVLHLSNRKALNHQTKKDLDVQIKGDEYFDRIEEPYHTMLYQTLSKFVSNEYYVVFEDNMNSFDYIFIDEAHYFFTDSSFNDSTNKALQWLLSRASETVQIWATATGKGLFEEDSWLSSKLNVKGVYELDQNYSHVRSLDFLQGYHTEHLAWLIDSYIKKKNRSVLLMTNETGKFSKLEDYLSGIYGDQLSFLVSDSTQGELKQYLDRSKKARDTLLDRKLQESGKNFPFKILISTTTIDSGVSIKDRSLGAIVTDLIEPEAIIQALGRKRPLDDSDQVDLFVNLPSNKRIEANLKRGSEAVDQINEYRADPEAFREKYLLSFPERYLWQTQPVCPYFEGFVLNDAKAERLFQRLEHLKEIQKIGFRKYLRNEYFKSIPDNKIHKLKPPKDEALSELFDAPDRIKLVNLEKELSDLCLDEDGNAIPIFATKKSYEKYGEQTGALDPDIVFEAIRDAHLNCIEKTYKSDYKRWSFKKLISEIEHLEPNFQFEKKAIKKIKYYVFIKKDETQLICKDLQTHTRELFYE